MTEWSVGRRIASHRLRRGLTQAELAGLVGLSVSMVKKIESGERAVTRFASLVLFAQALHISDLRDLTDLPLPVTVDGGRRDPAAGAVLTALLARYPLGASGVDQSASRRPRGAGLEQRLERTWTTWQEPSSFRYRAVGQELPGLIHDVQVALATRKDAERRQTLKLASRTYQLVRTWAKRTGEYEISLVAADRAVACALDADDLELAGAAAWNLAMILSAQGQLQEARDVAERARISLEYALAGTDDAPVSSLAVLGSLTLMAAALAAQEDDRVRTRALLHETDLIAARTGETNHHRMAFGPLNVAIHRVSTATELGRTEEALDLAERLDVVPAVSVERRLTFCLDAARCHARKRNDIAALHFMQRIHRESPEELRHNAIARETLRELADRSRPAWSAELTPLLASAAVS